MDFSGDVRLELFAEDDSFGSDFPLVHAQGRFGQGGNGDRLPRFRRPVEAEGLAGKLGQGDNCSSSMLLYIRTWEDVICFLLNEIVEIVDGFERAVNLVHHHGRELTGDDEFLVVADDVLDFLARGLVRSSMAGGSWTSLGEHWGGCHWAASTTWREAPPLASF